MEENDKSIDFLGQIRTGKIVHDRQRIYVYIQKHPGITLNDLSRGTKTVIQTTSARVSELMDMGVVQVHSKKEEIGMIKQTTNSMLIVQEDPAQIFLNKMARSKKRFIKALKAVLIFKEHLPDQTQLELKNLLK